MDGNLSELRIHMHALSRMVKIRGGLDKLRDHGILHMFVTWY